MLSPLHVRRHNKSERPNTLSVQIRILFGRHRGDCWKYTFAHQCSNSHALFDFWFNSAPAGVAFKGYDYKHLPNLKRSLPNLKRSFLKHFPLLSTAAAAFTETVPWFLRVPSHPEPPTLKAGAFPHVRYSPTGYFITTGNQIVTPQTGSIVFLPSKGPVK